MEFSDFVQTRSDEIGLPDRLKKACQALDLYAIGNAGAESRIGSNPLDTPSNFGRPANVKSFEIINIDDGFAL
jgi:hypothetical protein